MHGGLAEVVGAHELRLDVRSPAEAVHALLEQCPRARHVIEPAEWSVLVDGKDLDLRAYVAVMPFETMEIRPALYGAEGKAGPFKILAGFALIFGALGLAAFVGATTAGAAGAIGLGAGFNASFLGVSLGTFAKLGAVVALGGIVRTLSPSPKANFDDLADAAPSYTFPLLGQQTQQGARVPIVYGRAVTGSVVVSELETVTAKFGPTESGRHPILSTSTLEVVELISEGPIEGIEGGLAGVLLGDVPILASDGSSNFPGVELEVQVGEDDPAGFIVTQTGRPKPVGLQMRYSDSPLVTSIDGAVEWTITDPAVDECIATFSVPQAFELSGGSPVDTLIGADLDIRSDGGSWANVQYPWIASGDPALAIETHGGSVYNGNLSGLGGFLNATFWVLVDASGTPGVAYGDQVTAWVEMEFPFLDPGVWYRFQATFTFTADATAEAVVNAAYSPFLAAKCEILCNPMLYFTGFSSANTWNARLGSDFATRYPSDTGWVVTSTAADIAANGGGLLPWTSHTGTWVADGYAPNGFEFQIRTGPLSSYGPPPYDLRARALYKTDALPPGELANKVYVKSYTEVIREELSYPRSAVVKLTIPAEVVGGQIPRRTYRVLGRKLRIPTGYDPVAGTYPGTWDGTYQASEVWSDNPAFVLLDYLTSSRYGAGLDDADVDKWSLYEAAKRCDTSVAAWGGGTERRYRFGHVFQAKDDALKAAITIGAAMDTTLFWADGRTWFAQAKPRDPVRFFGASSVAEGRFAYTGASVQAVKTLALVGWVDPDRPLEAPLAVVERPYLEERFGSRELEIKAVGAITEGQALRKGRYELIAGERESELGQFSLPAAEMNLAPGEVVAIQDPHRAGVRLSGRVKALFSAGLIVQPDAITSGTIAPGDSIAFAYPDGGIHETTVDAANPTQITLDVPLDPARARVGMPWMVTSTTWELWRVIALEAGGGGRYDCTAHRLDPDLWTEVEDLTDPGSPLVVTLPSAPAAPVVTGAAWENYFATHLDTSPRQRLVVLFTTAGTWAEFEVGVAAQPVFARDVYETMGTELRVEMQGVPAGDVVAGTLTAWDAAHTAVSSGAAVNATKWPHPTLSAPTFSTETQAETDEGVEIRVEWGAVAGASYYLVIASHDGETVEDARWETDNLLARHVWPAGFTDYSLRVYARTDHEQASSVSLFTP